MSEFDDRHGLPPNPYNPHAWFVGEPVIGDDVWIGAFCVIDGSGGLSIGRGCDISAGAQIYTHSTVERCVSEREQPIRRASTEIASWYSRHSTRRGARSTIGCQTRSAGSAASASSTARFSGRDLPHFRRGIAPNIDKILLHVSIFRKV